MTREIVLLLPNIRSCHNVGAMFRTADAFGIRKLYLIGYTATPPKIQIDKVSLGAETWVPWEKKDDLHHTIEALKTEGYTIVALEQTSSSVDVATWSQEHLAIQKVALVVGNEVDGVDREALALCDAVVHIPMLGKKESLNVSIAAGVALYALHRS